MLIILKFYIYCVFNERETRTKLTPDLSFVNDCSFKCIFIFLNFRSRITSSTSKISIEVLAITFKDVSVVSSEHFLCLPSITYPLIVCYSKKNKKEPTPVIKFTYSVNLINKLYAFPLACKKTERQSKTVYVYACCTELRILE